MKRTYVFILLFCLSATGSSSADEREVNEIGVDPGLELPRAGESRSDKPSSRKKSFTVAEYFSPIKAGEDRAKEYGYGHLTFESYNITSENDFKAKLEGTWRLMFHCYGEAITVEKFRGSEINDGVVKGPGFFIYERVDDDFLHTITFYPSAESGLDLSTPSFKEGPMHTKILSLRSDAVEVQSEGFYPTIYRAVKVKETGEILFELLNTDLDYYRQRRICPDNSSPEMLLVPVDEFIS